MKKSFRKKQTKINKEVKRFNKYMEEDNAFLGRIYARQYSGNRYEFSDRSDMWVGVIRIYDKETNTYMSILGDGFSIERDLWLGANDFITKDLEIDIRKAIEEHKDYTKIHHNPRDAKPFYPSYEKNYSYKKYS